MSLTSRWLICVMNLEECRGKLEIRCVDDEVEVLDDWRATTWHSEPKQRVRSSLRFIVFSSLYDQNQSFRDRFYLKNDWKHKINGIQSCIVCLPRHIAMTVSQPSNTWRCYSCLWFIRCCCKNVKSIFSTWGLSRNYRYPNFSNLKRCVSRSLTVTERTWNRVPRRAFLLVCYKRKQKQVLWTARWVNLNPTNEKSVGSGNFRSWSRTFSRTA